MLVAAMGFWKLATCIRCPMISLGRNNCGLLLLNHRGEDGFSIIGERMDWSATKGFLPVSVCWYAALRCDRVFTVLSASTGRAQELQAATMPHRRLDGCFALYRPTNRRNCHDLGATSTLIRRKNAKAFIEIMNRNLDLFSHPVLFCQHLMSSPNNVLIISFPSTNNLYFKYSLALIF